MRRRQRAPSNWRRAVPLAARLSDAEVVPADQMYLPLPEIVTAVVPMFTRFASSPVRGEAGRVSVMLVPFRTSVTSEVVAVSFAVTVRIAVVSPCVLRVVLTETEPVTCS